MHRLLLGILAASAAAAASRASEAADSAAVATDAERQILEVERAWVQAENRHDAATLRRILGEGFVSTFGIGKLRDKEGFIASIVAGEIDPTQSQDLPDRTVRIDRDTAVVVETDTIRGTAKGTAYTEVYRITVTYIKRSGHWVAFAEHGVQVPPVQ